MAKKRRMARRMMLSYAGYVIVFLIAVYIMYSVWVYLRSVETTEEFLVCTGDECVKSFHIHSSVEPIICGELKWFGLEHGELGEQHTHKERNLIHFHERLRVALDTYEIIDYSPLQLRNFIGNMERESSDGVCLFGVCEGDACEGSDTPGRFRVIVNGQEREEKWDYIWKDGDTIKIIFE